MASLVGYKDRPGTTMICRSITLTSFFFCGALLCVKPAIAEEQKAWFWFTDCGTEALVFELLLDGKPLYRQTIPVCQTTRQDNTRSRKVSFTFQPGSPITWTGAVTTTAGQTLTAELRQSGADANDLVLGMSVSDGRTLHKQVAYIASMDRPNTAEIAKGLVIATHPTDTTNWVHAPGLFIRPECVHEIPNGAAVNTETDDVTLNGAVIDHWKDCAEPGISTRPELSSRESLPPAAPLASDDGWIRGLTLSSVGALNVKGQVVQVTVGQAIDNPGNCRNPTGYAIRDSVTLKDSLALLTSALMTQQKVDLHLSGSCDPNGMPNVIGVILNAPGFQR